MKKGKFSYLTIEENLKFCIDEGFLSSGTINLKFNMDGLPLFKSSLMNVWPILMLIEKCTFRFPLPVAIFCGLGKPEMSVYLKQFSEELTNLKSCDFFYNGVSLVIDRVLFICDVPARAMLQYINLFNAYYGCGYCRQKGSYEEDRIVFDETVFSLRNDEAYRLKHESNQKSLSPLAQIPGVGLFSSFPTDYQHLVCSGVTRKLCHFYFTSVKGYHLPCKLSMLQINLISDMIVHIRKSLPREFKRKIRPLSELKHYKAVEFRTFLLYVAPYVMKSFLPESYFNNLMLLHFSIYVFCSKRSEYHECATSCLSGFVHQCEALYSKKSLVYNIHCLLHLPYFVKKYGSIDEFSTFPFENYLSLLKKQTKNASHAFEHTINNVQNLRRNCAERSKTQVPRLEYTSTSPDNVCVTENCLIIISYLNGDLVSGYKLSFVKNLYEYPYVSSSLSIGYYRITTKYIEQVKPVTKCIAFPDLKSSLIVVFPFASELHFY